MYHSPHQFMGLAFTCFKVCYSLAQMGLISLTPERVSGDFKGYLALPNNSFCKDSHCRGHIQTHFFKKYLGLFFQIFVHANRYTCCCHVIHPFLYANYNSFNVNTMLLVFVKSMHCIVKSYPLFRYNVAH